MKSYINQIIWIKQKIIQCKSNGAVELQKFEDQLKKLKATVPKTHKAAWELLNDSYITQKEVNEYFSDRKQTQLEKTVTKEQLHISSQIIDIE